MSYSITQPTEYAVIGSVPLSTPAWECTNLHVLWNGPTTRGQDRIIPGSNGVRAKRRRATVTRRTLELVIQGAVKWDGTTYADPRVGLWTNINHLRTNVTDPLASSPGTRTLTLHLPDTSTVTGAIHVEGAEFVGDGYGNALATIDISIPAGALA